MVNIEEIISRQIHNWDRLRSVLRRDPRECLDEPRADGHRPQPVVAVSRQLGCGARHVVQIISRRTGREIFGCALVDVVAEDMNVHRQVVDRLDETVLSNTEVLIEGLLHGRSVDGADYLRSLVRVLRAFIVQGGVVLLGRGASCLVGPSEGVRVRMVAPLETRVENLRRYEDLDEQTARRQIKESDHQRAEFVRKYFKQDVDDPANYDIVLNVGTLRAETAAAVILRALEAHDQGLVQPPPAD